MILIMKKASEYDQEKQKSHIEVPLFEMLILASSLHNNARNYSQPVCSNI